MKILIIRNYPSYMTVKNNTYNIQEVGLAKALTRKGHICDILFWTDKEECTEILPVSDFGEVKVFYRRGKTLLKNTVYTGCKALFDQYDILQPCEYNQLQSWILAKKYPQKTIIYHGPYYSDFNKRYNAMCKVFDLLFLRRYIKLNTPFLVKSDMAKDFLLSKKIKCENITTVGVGMDVQMLSSHDGECKDELFLQMKTDTDELKLLYVGRLEKRRNIAFLFEVFSEILKKHQTAKLYMIGTGDVEYVKSVFEYAESLGVRKKIVWQERIEQKYLSEIYKEADVFLLPTEYEIFGMVLLEAMYYGTLVVTTRNGGSSTLITHGINGVIIDERDPKAWASYIVDLQQHIEELRALKQKASARVSEDFTWDSLAQKFVDQYRSLVLKNG